MGERDSIFWTNMILFCGGFGEALLPFYNHIIIVVQRQIAQIIDEIIHCSFLCGVKVGDELEVEAFVPEFFTRGPGLAVP